MKSRRAKVLHEVAGRSLVEHVVRQALFAGASPIVVVIGVQGDSVRKQLTEALPGAPLVFVEQTERLGTGDAVGRARPALDGFDGDVLILCGDVPALPGEAVAGLLAKHRDGAAALTVLSAVLDDPSGYGRIVRAARGLIQAIVEHRDCTAAQLKIREINTGTYCAHWPSLVEALNKLKPNNSQGEYYLTDAVRLLMKRGQRCLAVIHPRAEESMGVNSRRQLAELSRILNLKTLGKLMDDGVTIIDPNATWIDSTVTIGRDTTVWPGVVLTGRTSIGEDCVIRPGCRLHDMTVGDGAELLDHVIATDSQIGSGSHVGPMAHLRPGTVLTEKCKLGNFVETKKSRFGRGSKASHLSYIGDADVGEGVNIGAGTITCNYDGVNKHKTTLEDGVFIGSDTQLVAPVTIGKGAYVGAGSTITKNVPPGALALSRTDQRNIEGWTERRKK